MDFLVTGFLRSGTTYLCNLINTNFRCRCIYQPGQEKLITYRSNFNIINNIENKYPIGTNYNDEKIDIDKFTSYLINNNFLSEYEKSYNQRNARFPVGTKEVLAEDYINYLNLMKIPVFLITRRLIDVILSIKLDNKNIYTGSIDLERIIRMHIKSNSSTSNFKNLLIKVEYEELLANPRKILDTFKDIVRVDKRYDYYLTNNLIDSSGKPYTNNGTNYNTELYQILSNALSIFIKEKNISLNSILTNNEIEIFIRKNILTLNDLRLKFENI